MAADAKPRLVGVSELRPLLRRFLDLAHEGETFIITVDGEPKAALGPLPKDKKENP